LTLQAQRLSHLLNNAAKYTRQWGNITLTADCVGDWVVITVMDNGIGIPQEMMGRVFDLFTQVDSSLDRAQGGLGIGLTIVKRLVEMHSGTVEAHSGGLGQGSELTVRLPLTSEPGAWEPARAFPEQPTGPRRRVLIVDDNRDSAESLAMLLRFRGNDVRTAQDGPQGAQAAQDDQPELILLDIGMPGMSGYEVARRLRQRPEMNGVVIVAMTGWGQDEDRRKSKEAGFDHHLTKPIELAVVEQVLA